MTKLIPRRFGKTLYVRRREPYLTSQIAALTEDLLEQEKETIFYRSCCMELADQLAESRHKKIDMALIAGIIAGLIVGTIMGLLGFILVNIVRGG